VCIQINKERTWSYSFQNYCEKGSINISIIAGHENKRDFVTLENRVVLALKVSLGEFKTGRLVVPIRYIYLFKGSIETILHSRVGDSRGCNDRKTEGDQMHKWFFL
jgi:hypothetical protein